VKRIRDDKGRKMETGQKQEGEKIRRSEGWEINLITKRLNDKT
jgi:hypothetical protein